MRIGVIDIGSNSIKLLVAETGSTLAALYQTTLETRIGAGIDRDEPVLSQASMKAATAAVVKLIAEADRFAPENFAIVATSAVRDAVNRQDFIQRIEDATGHRLRVLSGEEEAAYIGRAITTDPALKEYPAFTLCDLGGGSLEFIRLEGGSITDKTSLQLGAVRLMERFVKDPTEPLPERTAARIADYVRTKIAESGFGAIQSQPFLAATGGAVNVARAVRAGWLGCSYAEVPSVITVNFLRYLSEELSAATLEERQRIPQLPAARADIMPVACIILLTVAEIAGARHFVHSLHNLRYGIAAAACEG
ncbi:hypothetical protein [Ruficoccus sp. ZRK36]|uniref:Ppx/GppA phosphatase family protein n=1 Tax=Ruficoccus sp. ZRK36 TaxID=2866311 RepID=UPI001C72D772|nr:hypothetical protein [Ruficoccus sp. ZRK36]QYY37046.1 hypothetical protein K0V07_06090 [Ruficoccus sp. ZRK36]